MYVLFLSSCSRKLNKIRTPNNANVKNWKQETILWDSLQRKKKKIERILSSSLLGSQLYSYAPYQIIF